MSGQRTGHLIERAVERMAELLASVPAAPDRAPMSPAPMSPAAMSPAPSAPEPAVVAAERVSAQAVRQGAGVYPDVVLDYMSPLPSRPEPDPVSLVPISLATLEAAGLAVAGARRSRVADEWRVTSTQLLRKLRAEPPQPGSLGNLLLITSAKPNEGKSFCALNLAGILTLGGLTEVLLVDVDSKPGSLTAQLGLSGHLGLFDLVADATLRPEDLVVPTAIAGLCILPIGCAPTADGAGPIGRTVTRPVAAVVERLARCFAKRVVILDAAPALATSDVSTLAPSVGEIAVIVEAERTQQGDLEAVLEMLRPCQNITLILNKVRLVTKHGFGHYHYYDN
jgi:Mrp family chromosome partitioning ATPase